VSHTYAHAFHDVRACLEGSSTKILKACTLLVREPLTDVEFNTGHPTSYWPTTKPWDIGFEL